MSTPTTTAAGITRGWQLSPELLRRIDALDGCRGRWIVDCREIEGDYSFALRSLDDSWLLETEAGQRYWRGLLPDTYPHKFGTVLDAAAYCAATGWRSKLLWCSDWLNDDCSWPGGYDAPSIIRSNARVFRDNFSKELAAADGDADGCSLDIRYVTQEMLETLAALESYPLISEDDHSELEMDLQSEAYEDWGRDDFRKEVGERLQELAPDDADSYWGSELADTIAGDVLDDWFRSASEQAGEYWEEESGGSQWISVKRVAAVLTVADLSEMIGG